MNIEPKFKVGSIVYTKFARLSVKINSIVITINSAGTYISYKCNKAEFLDRSDSPAVISCYPELLYKEDELTEERPKPESIYDLQEGDNYYLLDNLGCVQSWIFDGCSYDKKVIAQGNAFLTTEEAQREAKRREIHQELKRLANGYRFKHLEYNWMVRYDHDGRSLFVNFQTYLMGGDTVYFGTKDEVLKAIETIGEERLKKDYFGVENE